MFDENLNKEDEKLGEEINTHLEYVVPALDIAFRGLPSLLEMGEVGIRENYLHIFGEPIHLKVSNPSMEDYIYRGMHSAYLRMQLTHKNKPYVWPLGFPDETNRYKGYDWREKIKVADKAFSSIKEIVVLTGWMATGLIAWKGKRFVPTKKHVSEIFKSTIGGQVADDFELITSLCRNKFEYMIPTSENDRKDLIDLLPKVLSIENYFLEQYQHFLIENLKNTSPVRVRTSIIRLGEILFPNGDSQEALRELSVHDSTEIEMIQKSLSQLEMKTK